MSVLPTAPADIWLIVYVSVNFRIVTILFMSTFVPTKTVGAAKGIGQFEGSLHVT